VEACLNSIAAGVRKTHIIDGRLRHSLLLEIFTESGVGTEIIHDDNPDRISVQGRRPVLVR
jgi:acetylglutamate kinase